MNMWADFLFPSSCAGCDRLARGALCRGCLETVKRLGPCTCDFCGAPAPASVLRCGDCRGRDFRFDSARQAVEFSSTIRKAIHNFKYRSERCLADCFALLLLDLVDPEFQGLVTSVPPQGDRIRARGFDHGYALAAAVAARLDTQVTSTLKRVRRTEPQMRLEPGVRRRNLVGAFGAGALPPVGVLLVDDVFTTGATATEAARALKSAGASSVEVVCIARALSRPP